MEDSSIQMCEECGARPASVHLTQITPGKTTVAHLCEECARKKGIAIPLEPADAAPAPAEPATPENVCGRCGTKLSQLRAGGRLGCAACYAAFSGDIDQMLTQMHGSCVHAGKRYDRLAAPQPTAADLARLRQELAAAVGREEFEEAARLRDTINSLAPTATDGGGSGA